MDLAAELERHHESAFGWALSCCRWDRAAAEDVLQASYLKILDGRAAFAGRSAFKTWLFGIVRRTAAEHRRRRAVHRWLPLPFLNGRPESHAASVTAEVALVRAETSQRLIAALGRLPVRQREVLHLVFYEDLTIGEAADILRISIGTARTHYERGKGSLRDLLAEERHDG